MGQEAFPADESPRYLIHDNDKRYGEKVHHALRTMDIKSKSTSYRSPWQNGVCERCILSCRQDLLSHVVPLGEAHLRRRLHEYVRYFHEDRTHLGLGKETPAGRETRARPSPEAEVIAFPRVGGVHRRYEWQKAA